MKFHRIGLRILLGAVAIFLLLVSFRGFVVLAYSQQTKDDTLKTAARVQPADSLTREGFEHLYNMEYDAALRDFQAFVEAHPDDPAAVNHLLQSILTRELYREGALNAELYLADGFFHVQKSHVDPTVETRIRNLITQALQLSEKRLKSDPNDVTTLYARGVTRALNATYLGLVQKSWFGALRSGLGAYEDHAKVLRLSPAYSDAKLTVGFYTYAVGSLPWFERAAAFLLAFSGNKSVGAEYVSQAADGSGEASVDAKAAIALILARERRYPESLSLLDKLSTSYPHNFFFAVTQADVLKSAGRLQESVTAYRKVLRLGGEGIFPEAPLEQVAYKLGETLRLHQDYYAAAEAFLSVGTFPHASAALLSKATLAAGEMYDLLGQRSAAVRKYQELLLVDNGSPEARTARQLLNHPYRTH